MLRGGRFWMPHREHFYQRPIQAGSSHRRVLAAIALCNLLLLALGFATLYEVLRIPALVLALAGVIALLWRLRVWAR